MTISILVGLVSVIVFIFLGFALFAFYTTHPGDLNPKLQNIDIMPLYFIQQLPAGISGLLIAALLAVTMSTLDSSMNSVAAVGVTDFYRRFKKEPNEKTCLRLGRLLTLLSGGIATGVGILYIVRDIKSFFNLWGVIAAMLQAGVGSIFTLGLFTKRANSWGAMAGAIASIVAVISVKFFTDANFLVYMPVGLLTCIIVGYPASILIDIIAPPKVTRSLAGLTIWTPKKGADE